MTSSDEAVADAAARTESPAERRRRARARVAARSGTRRCPSPSTGAPAGAPRASSRWERSAMPTRGAAPPRRGSRPGRASRRAPRTSRRGRAGARSIAERRDRVEAPAVGRAPVDGEEGEAAQRLHLLAGGVEERLRDAPSSASGLPLTWTSNAPPSTASSFGTIARPITLPSSALRRTLVTRPDDTAVDDDLAALDRDRAGRALEADEHPLEAAVGDLLRRPLADPLELLVVLHEPRHRRLVQVRLGVGVLARRSRGPSRGGGSAAARGRRASASRSAAFSKIVSHTCSASGLGKWSS